MTLGNQSRKHLLISVAVVIFAICLRTTIDSEWGKRKKEKSP